MALINNSYESRIFITLYVYIFLQRVVQTKSTHVRILYGSKKTYLRASAVQGMSTVELRAQCRTH